MRRRARGVLAMAVLAVLGAALTSCVELPQSGGVVEAKQQGLANPVEVPFNNPPPPAKDANPGEIVTGFLNAMLAVPLQTNAAASYLSTAARARWQPQHGIVVYDDYSPPRGSDPVRIRLQGAHLVNGRGFWLGPLSRHRSSLSFPMRLEKGQWRINRAPNALLVPESWFQLHFSTDASVYYFDPSGRILVPEPVHVPNGAQLATALVRSLVIAPPPSLTGVEHSFIPAGLSSGLNVLVHGDGVADVNLRGNNPGPLDDKTTRLMLAQFAWTLAQVPSVKSFRLTIAGERITDASGNSAFPVSEPETVDPTDSLASGQIYALRNGRLVSGQPKAPGPDNGPFGRSAVGITSFAVSLDNTMMAGITPSRLLLGHVQGGGKVDPVYDGTRLLSPSWDFAGRLWDIDATSRGAVVFVVVDHQWHRVRVPGISGTDVRRFLVSRDGSRMVAVVHGVHTDHLVVSRIRYDARDHVVGATRAEPLNWQAGGSNRIRDIGWLSPTSVGVLHLLTQQISEVRTISVDGSTAPSQASPVPIAGRAKALATSPVDTDTSFAVLPTTLYDLSQNSSAVPYSGLRAFTYAG
jgi:hypothetical protein